MQSALEVLGDLYRVLPDQAALSWERDSNLDFLDDTKAELGVGVATAPPAQAPRRQAAFSRLGRKPLLAIDRGSALVFGTLAAYANAQSGCKTVSCRSRNGRHRPANARF